MGVAVALTRQMGVPAVDTAKVQLETGSITGGDRTFVVAPGEGDSLFAGVALCPTAGSSRCRGRVGGVHRFSPRKTIESIALPQKRYPIAPTARKGPNGIAVLKSRPLNRMRATPTMDPKALEMIMVGRIHL